MMLGHFLAYALVHCLVSGVGCDPSGPQVNAFERPPFRLKSDCEAEAAKREHDPEHQWVCRGIPASPTWEIK